MQALVCLHCDLFCNGNLKVREVIVFVSNVIAPARHHSYTTESGIFVWVEHLCFGNKRRAVKLPSTCLQALHAQCRIFLGTAIVRSSCDRRALIVLLR